MILLESALKSALKSALLESVLLAHEKYVGIVGVGIVGVGIVGVGIIAVNGTMKSDHIKRMITLTGDNINRLSLY